MPDMSINPIIFALVVPILVAVIVLNITIILKSHKSNAEFKSREAERKERAAKAKQAWAARHAAAYAAGAAYYSGLTDKFYRIDKINGRTRIIEVPEG